MIEVKAPPLYAFLSDGRVPMDNNFAERAIKPFVIDRKSLLISKAETGAEASATMMTVILTALRNGLIPERYLAWLSRTRGSSRLNASCRGPTTCRIPARRWAIDLFGVISDTPSEMPNKKSDVLYIGNQL